MSEPACDAAETPDTLLGWSDRSRRLERQEVRARRLDVADSWLVDFGKVRGLELHMERFGASCARHYGVARSRTARFLRAALRAVDARGRCFPRVEFDAGAGFRLLLRQAPPRMSSTTLALHEGADPRRLASIKGPDLDLLAELRKRAGESHGAGEVLLVSASGQVLEGAFSTLFWWRGDALCTSPLALGILPGVTRQLQLEVAASRHTRVELEVCRPHELDGCELWSVSALHGIRGISAWAGQPWSVAPPRRAQGWQQQLERMARPLHGWSADDGVHVHDGASSDE